MAEKYTTKARITLLEERSDHRWISGTGADAIFEDRSRGWFLVTTAGTFCFGKDKPEQLKAGEMVEITFQAKGPLI